VHAQQVGEHGDGHIAGQVDQCRAATVPKPDTQTVQSDLEPVRAEGAASMGVE
jgi:hypothetical protein